MHDLIARLAVEGAGTDTILQALEQGYAEGRFEFVPVRETVSRHRTMVLQHLGMVRSRQEWAPLALPQAPRPGRAGRGGPPDARVLAALAAALRQDGRWPDEATALGWAHIAALAPDLPGEDLPRVGVCWRARALVGRPIRDLLTFLACAPWRDTHTFDRYLRTLAAAQVACFPDWSGFLPQAARWLAAVVDDLSALVATIAQGGPVVGEFVWERADREWQHFARDRWVAARAALVPLLPVLWQGLVDAAPPCPSPARAVSSGAPDEPLTEHFFWRQVRRSDVLLAPPLPTVRSPVGQAWRWRDAAVENWTSLGPHGAVRWLLLSIGASLARAVAAIDAWAATGFADGGTVPADLDADAVASSAPGDVDLGRLSRRAASLAMAVLGWVRATDTDGTPPIAAIDAQALALLDPTGVRARAAALLGIPPPAGAEGDVPPHPPAGGHDQPR